MAKSKARRRIDGKKRQKRRRWRTNQQRFGQLETLELRQLLSVSPTLNGNAANFNGDAADDVLHLRVNASSQLEFSFDGGATYTSDFDADQDGEQALTIGNAATIRVTLGDGADQLHVDATLTAKLVKPLEFDGGTGVDSLFGPDAAATWSITAKNAGALAAGASANAKVSFKSAENLTGGSDSDSFAIVDRGVIGDGGEVTGKIDGGGGSDAVDYSQFDHEVSVSIAESIASGVADFAAIESFIGGNHSYSTPNLTSSSTSAVQRGERVKVGTSIYQYLGLVELPSQSLAEFSATNPSGVQYFNPAQWRLAERNQFVGDEETSTWSINAADAGTVGGVSFSKFQNIVGGTRDDTFTFASGGSISGSLDGGGASYFDFTEQSEPEQVEVGERVIVASGDTNVIYVRTGTPLNAAAGQTLDLATENYAGANWSAITVTPDHVDVSALSGVSFDLSNASVKVGSTTVVATSEKIGKFTANATAGDTVVGPNTDTVWEVIGEDIVKVNGTEFVDVETLTGSSTANDQFVFTGPTAAITTRIDGGTGGQDSFAFRNGTSKEVIQLSGNADQNGTAPNRVRNSNTVNYANIDPLTLSLGNIKGTPDDDSITVTVNNGNLALSYVGATFVPLNNGVYGMATSHVGGSSSGNSEH